MDYSQYEIYDFDSVSAFNLSTGYKERSYQMHWHSYGEILYVGPGDTNIYKVNRNTYELLPGDFVLIWPMKISIPDVFRTINTLRRYPDDWRSKNFYSGLTQRSGKASACIACGQCERVCPQHLPIIELMKEAAEILD